MILAKENYNELILASSVLFENNIVYNKENLFAEFKMQKTNADKVKWLKEMKQLKRDKPSMFRNTEITQKNFDNLITELI